MIICNEQHHWWDIRGKVAKGEFDVILTKSSHYNKQITFTLAENNIPFTRISYGAGVVKIVKNDGSICDKCHGKGVSNVD